MRARTLRALGATVAADVAWTQALALNPRDPKILFHHARALRDDQDFEGAAQLLTRAIVLGHHSAPIWDARGRIYLYDLQSFDKAVLDLEHTIAFVPASPRYWFNYATAMYKNKDCGAVSALMYYLSLCEAKTCPVESMDWTAAAAESLHTSFQCRPRRKGGVTDDR